jgi:hypothetical protein
MVVLFLTFKTVAARFVGKNWIEPDTPNENQTHCQFD